ncbi:MAG: hypothetical protein QXW40_06225 [Thermofilum sp.]
MERLLKNPDEVLKAPLKLIEELDIIIRRVDEVLREFDSKILSKPPELLMLRERRTVAMSPSYPGQTVTDYCLECLERHYAKAHGLLEEAERFSLKYGKITPEAREKIRRAIEEIVTAEDDLGTNVDDEEFRKELDEIKVMQRDVRKFMWAKGLTTVSESIDDLRVAKEMVKKLLDKTYEVAERYRRKHGGECPACKVDPKKFFEMLCEKIGDKCFDALQKYLEDKISKEEFIKTLMEEGKSKGITDEDIEKMIRMATRS